MRLEKFEKGYLFSVTPLTKAERESSSFKDFSAQEELSVNMIKSTSGESETDKR